MPVASEAQVRLPSNESLDADPCLQYFGLDEADFSDQHDQRENLLEPRGVSNEEFGDGISGSTITIQGLRKLLTLVTGTPSSWFRNAVFSRP